MRHSALLSAAVILLCIISCDNSGNKKEPAQVQSISGVNVYYFHFTRRCATCLAVEENARKAVESLFPNEVRSGEYSFTSLNLDEASTRGFADSLGIGGQSLLIIHGDKKIDITGPAWLAAHDQGKMMTEIKSGIEKILF